MSYSVIFIPEKITQPYNTDTADSKLEIKCILSALACRSYKLEEVANIQSKIFWQIRIFKVLAQQEVLNNLYKEFEETKQIEFCGWDYSENFKDSMEDSLKLINSSIVKLYTFCLSDYEYLYDKSENKLDDITCKVEELLDELEDNLHDYYRFQWCEENKEFIKKDEE